MMPDQIQGKRRSKARIFLYIALFLIAFTVRFFSSATFFFAPLDQGHRNFEIFDSSYHIRRVEMTLRDFPHVPFYDTYHYYPDNPPIPWPAGYTLLLSFLAKPIDLIFASTLITETLVGAIPCVLEAVTTLLFLWFFSRYISFPIAFLAALLFGLSFINISYSELGNIDHHYFITLLLACAACLLSVYDKKRNARSALLLGAFLGLSLFFNVSFIQYVLILLFVVLYHLLVHKENRHILRPTVIVFAATLAGSLLAAFSTPAGRHFQISYDEISFFQVLLILLTAVLGIFLYLWLIPSRISRAYRIVISVVLAGSVTILGWATYRDFIEGARFVLLGNRLNSIQSEEASILAYLPMWQEIFTWFVFFFPLGIFSFYKNNLKGSHWWAAVTLFSLHGLVTGFSHLLYVQMLYPWYALLVALGIHEALKRLKPYLKQYRVLLILPFLIQALYITWSTKITKNEIQINLRKSYFQTIEALSWLRQHSPTTSHFHTGDGLAEYSVLAHRDFGHQMVRIAHRPVMVSPFSTPQFLGHMQDYVRFTFCRDEGQALEIMKKYKARYLVLDERDNRTPDFYLSILEGEPDWDKFKSEVDFSALHLLFRNNLLLFDGELRWNDTPPVKHFRLIYEGRSKFSIPLMTPRGRVDHVFNTLKIFERVNGVHVTAHGYLPEDQVVFRLPLCSNTGRRFTYSSSAMADQKGRVFVTLPYATEPSQASAVTSEIPFYEVVGPFDRRKLSIKEEQVIQGTKIELHREP